MSWSCNERIYKHLQLCVHHMYPYSPHRENMHRKWSNERPLSDDKRPSLKSAPAKSKIFLNKRPSPISAPLKIRNIGTVVHFLTNTKVKLQCLLTLIFTSHIIYTLFQCRFRVISCSKSLKSTLPFCSEHLNVFIYAGNSVFFEYRRVIFNFKTHMKNLNSYF